MGRRDAIVAGVAAGVVAVSGVRARRRTVGPVEERIFRTVNTAPDSLSGPVWAVMQSGSLGAVFVVGEVVRRAGHRRRAIVAVAAGTVMWAGAKVVKPWVGRGRPAACLDGVRVRGHRQSGLGYPSGHAAVAVTLALVSSPVGRLDVLTGSLATAGVTGLARIYVGAHLPLDVAGGYALGTIVGGAARRLV